MTPTEIVARCATKRDGLRLLKVAGGGAVQISKHRGNLERRGRGFLYVRFWDFLGLAP